MNADENRLEHSFMRAQRRDVCVYASSEGSLLKVAFMRAKSVLKDAFMRAQYGVCLSVVLCEHRDEEGSWLSKLF